MQEPCDEAHYFSRLAGEGTLLSILHPLHTSTPPIDVTAFDSLVYDAEASKCAAQLLQPLADQPLACSVIVTNYRVVVIACRPRVLRPLPAADAPAADPNPRRLHRTREWDFRAKTPLPETEARRLYHTELSRAAVFTIPHMTIESSKAEGGGRGATVTINTKHTAIYRIGFVDVTHGTRLAQLLNSMQAQSLGYLPAFDYFKARAATEEAATKAAGADFGWSIYQEDREYERQLTRNYGTAIPQPAEFHTPGRAGHGIDLRPWFRLTTLGEGDPDDEEGRLPLPITPFISGVGTSPTYPVKICVPTAASEKFLISEALAARSRGRIPAVSFVNLRTGAVLARASQPLNKSKNLHADSKLCNFLINHYTTYNCKPREDYVASQAQAASLMDRKAAPPSLFDAPRRAPPSLTDASPPRGGAGAGEQSQQTNSPPPATSGDAVVSAGVRHLNVVDCRPKTAAMGNQAVGGGYESYDFCKTNFHNIENIHAVNSSFAKLKHLLTTYHGRNLRQDFLAQLQETGWLYHMSCILNCAERTVAMLERGESCLVHCTDGWDRTSQITALAMVLTDPYYRTLRGFACLIEKEFADFGHKFAERLGHMRPGTMSAAVDSGVSGSDTESQQVAQSHKQQPCPAFPQFLDAMHQLLAQFPEEFEFTDAALRYLYDHCYSCYYGTFLCNAHKERLLEGVTAGTSSVWSDMLVAAHLERIGARTPFFLQPRFKAEAYAKVLLGSRDIPRALALNSSSKNLRLWEDFYLRDDPDRWGTIEVLTYRARSAEVLGIASDPAATALLPAPSFAPWDAAPSSSSTDGESSEEKPKHTPLYHEAFMAWNSDELAIMQAHRRLESVRHADIRRQFREISATNRGTSSSLVEASPSQSESAMGTVGVGAVNARHCWICNAEFGFFKATKNYCSECRVKAPICGGCVDTDRHGRKLCRNCFAIGGKN